MVIGVTASSWDVPVRKCHNRDGGVTSVRPSRSRSRRFSVRSTVTRFAGRRAGSDRAEPRASSPGRRGGLALGVLGSGPSPGGEPAKGPLEEPSLSLKADLHTRAVDPRRRHLATRRGPRPTSRAMSSSRAVEGREDHRGAVAEMLGVVEESRRVRRVSCCRPVMMVLAASPGITRSPLGIGGLAKSGHSSRVVRFLRRQLWLLGLVGWSGPGRLARRQGARDADPQPSNMEAFPLAYTPHCSTMPPRARGPAERPTS
jgi:hypothetical protein